MSRINETFDGKTFDAERDKPRLNAQLAEVRSFMMNNPGYHTLDEIAAKTKHPTASISARLRDLRKSRFGGYLVLRRRRSKGLYEYQLGFPETASPSVPTAITAGIIVSGIAWSMLLGPAMGQGYQAPKEFEGRDPALSRWFETLMQPDNPHASCCGYADAYWADDVRVENGQVIAIITDTRPDGPLGRRHIPPGTRFVVPNHKLKFDRGNPTGHTVIFVNASDQVLCFVQNTGI